MFKLFFCGGTKCKTCPRVVPACQLTNGQCSYCVSKGKNK